MALDSSFWSADWEDILLAHDFSSATFSSTAVDTAPNVDWYKGEFTNVYGVRQVDYSSSPPRTDHTHCRFFCRSIAGYEYTFELVRFWSSYPTTPDFGVTYYDAHNNQCRNDSNCPNSTNSVASDIEFYWPRSNAGTYSDGVTVTIYHYQGWTWYGYPAEVIASAIMQVTGGDYSWINTSALSAAQTGQASAYGSKFIMATREVGETLGDLVKRVAFHCNDLLYIDMNGKMAMASRSSPVAGPTSMLPSDVLSAHVRLAREHIANRATTSFGEWTKVSGNWANMSNGPDYYQFTYNTKFDRTAESDKDGRLTGVYEDTTSQSKYGLIDIGTQSRDVLRSDDRGRLLNGKYETTQFLHLPYIYDEDDREVTMSRLEDVDSQLRREVTIKQDLRGLDYDIGAEVTGIELTGDGRSIASAICISKTINFANLTVESVLLEEPV